MRCWRRHNNASFSSGAWGNLEWVPTSSTHSTPALWKASWLAASLPGMETAPAAIAKLCKGLCELPTTLYEVSFPPSRTSTPGDAGGKPRGSSVTSATPSHGLFSLLPSGRQLCSIWSRTSQLRDSFFPQTIRLLNTQNWHLQSTPLCPYHSPCTFNSTTMVYQLDLNVACTAL